VNMPAPIVFFDIAGEDSAVLQAFYSAVFNWNVAQDGGFSTSVLSPTISPATLMGVIRQDPAETLFYLGVEDIASKMLEIVEKGGAIDQARFEVPDVAVVGLFKDPAGNRVGLVEVEGGKVKIP